MKNFFIKNKIAIAIIAIVAVSFFLRTYHLADWLHFQLDQSRDAFLIKDVTEKGISELPLLGPRAGGSFLRLGPAYYYLMYLLAEIAKSVHPVVFVLPEIIASIAFVPIFYLLSRRLFNKNWSLALTFLAVNSTFLVTYDRFSWNPNLLPLFSLITIYSWLKYFDAKKKGNKKHSFLWVTVTALSVGIFIQLHFVAFVAIPIILALSALIFWLRSRILDKELARKYTKNVLREIALFIVIFVAIQTPVLLNEYISGWANTKQLFLTVSEKGKKDTSHNPSEKLIQNLWVYPKGYFIAITGNQGVDFPVWLIRPNLDIKCDDNCRKSFTNTIMALMFFAASGIVFLVTILKKTKKPAPMGIAEWEFLVLLALWVMVPWWSFFSLSFALRPRFFLFSIIPFWIIVGILFKEIAKNSLGKKIAFLAAIILFISNIANIAVRFNRLADATETDRENYPQDQILFQDESYPVVLAQQQQIADWIRGKNQDQPKDFIFLWAPSFYYRPILYLMDNTEVKGKTRYFTNYPMWLSGNYFAVTRATDPADFFRKEKPELFTVADKKEFGTLTVYQLELTEKGINEAKNREEKFKEGERLGNPEKVRARCLKNPKATCRYTWRDVFSKITE